MQWTLILYYATFWPKELGQISSGLIAFDYNTTKFI